MVGIIQQLRAKIIDLLGRFFAHTVVVECPPVISGEEIDHISLLANIGAGPVWIAPINLQRNGRRKVVAAADWRHVTRTLRFARVQVSRTAERINHLRKNLLGLARARFRHHGIRILCTQWSTRRRSRREHRDAQQRH